MRKSFSVLFIAAFIMLVPSKSFADCSGSHADHSFFCPNSGYNLFGASYNPATENWGWYMGARTAFFHPARWVWVGGVGFGIAFDQSNRDGRGPVLVPTFVPLQIGALSLEMSLNRVKSRDIVNSEKRERLVILAWNWRF